MLTAIEAKWHQEIIDEYVSVGLDQLEVLLSGAEKIIAWIDAHPTATPEEYDAWRVSQGMISMLRSIKRVGIVTIRRQMDEQIADIWEAVGQMV